MSKHKHNSKGPKVQVRILQKEAGLVSVVQKYQPTEVLRRMRTSAAGLLRSGLVFGFKLSVATLIGAVVALPMFSAFEAHIIQVTASPVNIDPPVLSIPGDIGWNNPIGGVGLSGQQSVSVTTADPDVQSVYYSYVTGTTSPEAIFNHAACGIVTTGTGTGPATTTAGVVSIPLDTDAVVEAVSCASDGQGGFYQSVTNTKIYFFDPNVSPVTDSSPEMPGKFALGSFSSPAEDGDVLVGSNVSITGDVHSNHDLTATGGGSSRSIVGDVSASGDVQADSFVVSGSIATGTSSFSAPNFHIQTWKERASLGGTVNGSLVFPPLTAGIELGPTEVLGNVVLGSSSTVTVRGTLYIHGSLRIDPGTVITQDPAYANRFTLIIVDGTVDIGADVSFVKAGSSGIFALISNAPAQPDDQASIDLAPSASNLGDVVLQAVDGDIHVRQGRTLIAAYGATGNDAANPAVRLGSDVTVQYRDLPSSIGVGASFAPPAAVVINEFIPNPVGSELGTVGLPLDGQWVEIYNGMAIPVDVNGWYLYDSNATGSLPITPFNVSTSTDGSATSSTVIAPGGRLVVYRDGNTDFNLNYTTDVVRLYNGNASTSGISLIDSKSYTYVGGAPTDKSFTRAPDGSSNWVDPEPSPSQPNNEFFSTDIRPLPAVVYAEEEKTVDAVAVVVGPTLAELTASSTSTDATTTPTSTPVAVVPEQNYGVGGGGTVLGTSTETGTPEPTSTPPSTDPNPEQPGTTTPPLVDPATTPVVDTGSGSGLEPLPQATTSGTAPVPDQSGTNQTTVTPPPATEPQAPPAETPPAPAPDPAP